MCNDDDITFIKFCPINVYSLCALKHKFIYFASPEKLNDPLDCVPDIQPLLKKELKEQTNMSELYIEETACEINKKMHETTKKFGIFSASNNLFSSPLWSHYGNSHKGMAITYEFPAEFLSDNENFVSHGKVKYEPDDLAKSIKNYASFFTQTQRTVDKEKLKESISELANEVLLLKDPGWEYEKERRIISVKAVKREIEERYIKKISFGLATPDEHINLIRSIVSADLYKIIRKSDSLLGLDETLIQP